MVMNSSPCLCAKTDFRYNNQLVAKRNGTKFTSPVTAPYILLARGFVVVLGASRFGGEWSEFHSFLAETPQLSKLLLGLLLARHLNLRR